MMSRKKGFVFICIALIIILLSFFIYNYLSKQSSKDNLQFQTTFMDNESIVYLGDETVKNELLFVFDYSCIWCSRWIDEVFPHVKQLVDDGKIKFRTQSMVFLDAASLQLSELDQNLKQEEPDKYFAVFSQMMNDGLKEDLEQLLANHYLDELITNHQLNEQIIEAEPKIDVIHLTQNYTDGLTIESVPTVIVNGEKIDDPFDIKEIESLLN